MPSSTTTCICGKCGGPCPAEARYCPFCGFRLVKVHLFYSYARKDESLRKQLENHLTILKYRGLITTWHDRDIEAGEKWAQQIDIHLNRAHIILLLISPDFIATPYCYCKEMKRALERHDLGEALVVPILLRPVRF